MSDRLAEQSGSVIQRLRARLPFVTAPKADPPADLPAQYPEFGPRHDHHYWFRVTGVYECHCGATMSVDEVRNRV